MNTIEEAAIQAIAEKMGIQISHLLAGSLREMLDLMKANRRKTYVHQTHQLDEFLTASDVGRILKISKSQQKRSLPFPLAGQCASGGRIWMTLFRRI